MHVERTTNTIILIVVLSSRNSSSHNTAEASKYGISLSSTSSFIFVLPLTSLQRKPDRLGHEYFRFSADVDGFIKTLARSPVDGQGLKDDEIFIAVERKHAIKALGFAVIVCKDVVEDDGLLYCLDRVPAEVVSSLAEYTGLVKLLLSSALLRDRDNCRCR